MDYSRFAFKPGKEITDYNRMVIYTTDKTTYNFIVDDMNTGFLEFNASMEH